MREKSANRICTSTGALEPNLLTNPYAFVQTIAYFSSFLFFSMFALHAHAISFALWLNVTLCRHVRKSVEEY